MSQEEQKQPPEAVPMAPKVEDANEHLLQEANEKYKELYLYSTDILLKEHERFNRADEKASKYATMFFFLIGAVAYFDKWIFDRLKWPHNFLRLFLDVPLVMVGLITLVICAIGLILAHHAIKIRPVVSRPLNKDVLDFFENETRITVYYGLAKENSNAYAENKKATDAKYTILKWAYYIMLMVFALLAVLAMMYIACIFADKLQISFNYGEACGQ
jgi:hypothetical protein